MGEDVTFSSKVVENWISVSGGKFTTWKSTPEIYCYFIFSSILIKETFGENSSSRKMFLLLIRGGAFIHADVLLVAWRFIKKILS